MSKKQWIPPEYNIVINDEQAKKAFQKIAKHQKIAFDVETTGLSFVQDKIIGFSLAYRDLETQKLCGYYFPIRHKLGKKETRYGFSLLTEPGEEFKSQVSDIVVFSQLYNILSNKKYLLIGHNLKFDIGMLYREYMLRPDDFLKCSLFDTRVAEAMIDSLKVNEKKRGMLSLKKIVWDYVDFKGVEKLTKFRDFKSPLDEVSIVELGEYCIDDSVYSYFIHEQQEQEIQVSYNKLFYEIEMPLIPVLCRMEYEGINIDREHLKNLDKEISPKLENFEKEFQNLSGTKINLKSSPKLRKYLYENLKLDKVTKRVRRKKGNQEILATDSDSIRLIMSKINKNDPIHKILSIIADYLNLYSIKKTYVDGFLKLSKYDSKIHSDYDSVGARSSRFSSSPNLQNLPRDEEKFDIRKAFIPAKGKEFSIADWSGMQFRIVAALSQDKVMVEAFKKGEDPHKKTAQGVFVTRQPTDNQRYKGKTINFSIIFGATEYSLRFQLKCSLEKAKQYIQNFYSLYNGFASWKTNQSFEIEKNGYVLTAWGRKRKYYFGTMFPDYEMRSVINTIIQGTEADILKDSLVKLEKELKKHPEWQARIVVHIHDEIVVENSPQYGSQVRKTIEKTMFHTLNGIDLPVDIFIKKSLSKKHE